MKKGSYRPLRKCSNPHPLLTGCLLFASCPKGAAPVVRKKRNKAARHGGAQAVPSSRERGSVLGHVKKTRVRKTRVVDVDFGPMDGGPSEKPLDAKKFKPKRRRNGSRPRPRRTGHCAIDMVERASPC